MVLCEHYIACGSVRFLYNLSVLHVYQRRVVRSMSAA